MNNSAIFAEIVPESQRSTVYAFDRSFEVRICIRLHSLRPAQECSDVLSRESCGFTWMGMSAQGAIGACGAPLVGIVAERVFGFKGVSAADALDTDHSQARALSNALFVSLVVPWTACLLFYFGESLDIWCSLLQCCYGRTDADSQLVCLFYKTISSCWKEDMANPTLLQFIAHVSLAFHSRVHLAALHWSYPADRRRGLVRRTPSETWLPTTAPVPRLTVLSTNELGAIVETPRAKKRVAAGDVAF